MDRVRAATVEDLEAIAGISVRGWRFAYRGHVPDEILDGLSEEERVREWGERVREPGDTRAWVVEREGRVAGFAFTGPGRDPDLPRAAGDLYALYVEPAAVGTGLGRELFARAVDDLSERGFDPVVVWVLRENERARRFYERAGFREDGATKVEDYEGAPMHEVRYRADSSIR